MDLVDNLAVWRLVNACAASKSLSEAALAENIDLAAASRMISQLEKRLGFSLLDRSTRPATPTNGLHALAPAAKKMIRAQAEALDAAKLFKPDSGEVRQLRVSIPVNWSRKSTLQALFQFEKKYPTVRFEIVADAGIEGMTDHGVDIALLGYRPVEKEIFHQKIKDEATALFASVNYLRRCGEPKCAADLINHTLLMRNPSNRSFSSKLENGSETLFITDKFRVHYGDAATCRQALLAGEGIAVDLCFAYIAEELAAGTVVPILPGWHRELWERTVACPVRLASDPLIRSLMTHLKEATLQSYMDSWHFWYERFGLPLSSIEKTDAH